MSQRLNQLARLEAATEHLNTDELEVVTQVAEGAASGTEIYGHLNVDTPDREFLGEGLEELRDGAVLPNGPTGVAAQALLPIRSKHPGPGVIPEPSITKS